MPATATLTADLSLAQAQHMLRPSEYTAALIQALLVMPSGVAGGDVLEMGFGSGVVLAALARMGAASLSGIDCEAEAILAAGSMMQQIGWEADLRLGTLWEPVRGRRFSLIVANLPHFPTDAHQIPDRLPSWSCGGHDGRRLLNPFLAGLADHIAPGGHAVITHNACVDLEETQESLAANGLRAAILSTVMLPLPREKLAILSPDILAREDGRTIHRFGIYSFVQVHMLDISAAAPGAE
jgi:release factor glutamine methyltransferase